MPNGITNVGDIILSAGLAVRYPSLRLLAGDGPFSGTVFDANADGILDLAVTNRLSGDVSVLLGNDDGTFQDEHRFAVDSAGAAALTVAAADLDQDGQIDLVVSTGNFVSGIRNIVILPGNGDGSFQTGGSFSVGTAGRILITDQNQDGLLDILVAPNAAVPFDPGNPVVSLLLGNGDGTFQPNQIFPAGVDAEALAAADFNRDGITDLVFAGREAVFQFPGIPNFRPGAVVWLGQGGGVFGNPQSLLTATGPNDMTVADLNGDGLLDVATAQSSDEQVSVFLGKSDGTFQSRRDFPAGPRLRSIDAGDVNRDGVQDLVVANNITTVSPAGNSDPVSVLLGNGDGSFQAPQSFTVGDGPSFVRLADFDGNGVLDIVALNQISDDVSILFGSGDGTFPTQQRSPAGTSLNSLVVADVNADHIPDVVTANPLDNAIGLLLGNADGSFQAPQQFAAGNAPNSVVSADINGDSAPDLVMLTLASEVAVLLGNNTGTFQAPLFTPAVGTSLAAVTAADVNADGLLDVLAANSDGMGPDDVLVLLGKGDGSFQAPLFVAVRQQVFEEFGGGRFITTTDFNGDSVLDMAVLTFDTRGVFVLLGKGDGTFRTAQQFTTGSFLSTVRTADINGDGLFDLVTLNSGDQTGSVLFGNGNGTFQAPLNFSAEGRAMTVADVNGDFLPDFILANSPDDSIEVRFGNGDGSFQAPLRFSVGFNPEEIVIADLNGDTLLDIVTLNITSNDISVLLASELLSVDPADVTPPPAPDLGLINVGVPADGVVTVTGAAGSVEPEASVTVTNIATGVSVTTTANADGSFSVQITAFDGHSLALVVTDAAGNVSPGRTTQIGPPVQITITEPPSFGPDIRGPRIRVRGTVQGPLNTGVNVNGVTALVHNGQFIADGVFLGIARTTLTATATTLGGQTAVDSIEVRRDTVNQLLSLTATPTSGIAPLEVSFTYNFGSTIPIQSLSIDFEGDGIDDFTTTDPTALLEHTYTTPGLFDARLSLTDEQGGMHTAQAAVAVQDVVELNALLQQLWSGMNTALLAGDAETAKSFLDAAARKKYGSVFDVLLSDMPQIVASYSALQPLSLSGSIGEYGINRVIDGQNRLFLIYFLKNEEGVWQLTAM